MPVLTRYCACTFFFVVIDLDSRVLSSKGGLGLVASLAGILGGLSGPAAPIVLPIVAGLVLAAWVHQVYKQT